MSGPRGWLALRLSFRFGRYRWLLRFPPRFHRWQLIAALAILLPVGYVVSAVPTVMAMDRLGVRNHPLGTKFIEIFYAPLIWLEMNVPWSRAFFEGEVALLAWMFGE